MPGWHFSVPIQAALAALSLFKLEMVPVAASMQQFPFGRFFKTFGRCFAGFHLRHGKILLLLNTQ